MASRGRFERPADRAAFAGTGSAAHPLRAPGRPRWRKLRGDLRASRGRVVVMVAALGTSLGAILAVLGAHAVLDTAIAASYRGSRPAEASLHLAGDVGRELLAAVRGRPGVADADARAAVSARVRVGAAPSHSPLGPGGSPSHGPSHSPFGPEGSPADSPSHGPSHSPFGHSPFGHSGGPGREPASAEWQPLKLFVVDDFADVRLNVFRRESGAWPPPAGAMLLERTAVSVVGAGEGDLVTVQTAGGSPRTIAIAGIVHDAGLAPAWQERTGYGYIARETLALLGEEPVLHELRVSFRPAPTALEDADESASALAEWLTARGHAVQEIRVPQLGAHPHQGLMDGALFALLAFAVLLVLLSAVLIATLLSAMLGRQVREIGVMKALGARTGQIASLYAVAVAILGLASLAIAVPLGILGARALVRAGAFLLNIEVEDGGIPAKVIALVVGAGLLVPLGAAAVPVLRAARTTVRAALAAHGARADRLRPSPAWMPLFARNALRRPGRLLLTLALLTAGGSMAMTALHLEAAFQRTLAKLPAMRRDDLEIRLAGSAPVDLAARLARVPGVRVAEAWGSATAIFARPGRRDIARTYPDGGHGSFAVLGAPPDTALADYPVAAGRWLRPGDTDAIVLNQRIALSRGLGVGDRVDLSLDGIPSSWTVVGIVEEVPPFSAFASDAGLARAIGAEGRARLVRVATSARSAEERWRISAELERAVASAGATVSGILPFARMYQAIEAHLALFVHVAIAMAAIIALVGLIGLATALGVSVAERTREIGVLKAIGAGPGRIALLVVGEAALVAAASWILAAAVSLPLSALVVWLVNGTGTIPASFAVSAPAIAGWLPVVVAGGALASLAAARRASRLTVRQALDD